jgi:hypothetical protein
MGPGLTLSNNNTEVNATANSTLASTYLIPSSGKVMISASLLNANFPDRGDRVIIGIMKQNYYVTNAQLGQQGSACFSDYGSSYINGGGILGGNIAFTNNQALIDLALYMSIQKMWIRVNGTQHLIQEDLIYQHYLNLTST